MWCSSSLLYTSPTLGGKLGGLWHRRCPQHHSSHRWHAELPLPPCRSLGASNAMRDKLAEHGAFLAAFVGVLVVGTVARVLWIGAESLRLDEAQSIWQASHSMEFIRTYMLKNVHLPLHNSLLHIWMTYFGSGEIAVRMFAVIPGILGIPALYLLAREFLKKEWALLAMAIAALSPFWIWYSREIRMYSLLALIVTL